MTYYFKGSSPSISFTKYEDPEDIYDEIKSGGATLQKKEKEKRKFKSELNEITRRDPKHFKNIWFALSIKIMYCY